MGGTAVDQTHFVFNETSDSYPLTVMSVTLLDEGTYWCQARDGVSFRFVVNSTDVRIRGKY